MYQMKNCHSLNCVNPMSPCFECVVKEKKNILKFEGISPVILGTVDIFLTYFLRCEVQPLCILKVMKFYILF